MYKLFLDTNQDYCHIAIFNNQKIFNKISIKTNNNLTDLVVEHIDNLIKETKIKKNNIESIYILNGPGSFTGIRVGILIAQTWNLVFKTKIYVCDTLRFQILNDQGISVLDAKGDKLYIAIYDKALIIKPKIINKNELNEIKNKYLYLKIFENYNNVDIFKNLLKNIDKFKKVNNPAKIDFFYIKKAI